MKPLMNLGKLVDERLPREPTHFAVNLIHETH
jgi:hypothetical protein